MNKKCNILAVGSIAIDSLETCHGVYNSLLGGSATYFSIACSYFSSVSTVGVVGSDFPQEGWGVFKKHNINTDNILIKCGKTFSWGGKYNQDFSSRKTVFTDLGVFDGYIPHINKSDARSSVVFLGNIQPALQLAVIKQLKVYNMLVGDTMNLWINSSKQELLQVLKYLDLFLINDEEAQLLTGYKNLQDSANKILDYGPDCVIIKCGSRGCFISNTKQHINVPAYRVKNLMDPTGAGDSFAGGYLGYSVLHGFNDPLKSAVVGSAVASFTVEKIGIQGLHTINVELINQRVQNILNTIN